MLITRDHFVPHVSTVPANAGQTVGLYVREKVKARPGPAKGRVVLFVHGATVPAVPDFDLDYKSYNCREQKWTGFTGLTKASTSSAGTDAVRVLF